MLAGRLKLVPVCSVLIIFYIFSYINLRNHLDRIEKPGRDNAGVWNLPSSVLFALAGEFKGMVADYLVLEAGSRLGTEVVRTPDGGFKTVEKHYDWPAIHRIFVSSQMLDPSFEQTYMVAQGWLPWPPANMVSETQEILKKASENRPWDWRVLNAIGFNTYYFLNQQGEAGKIYLQAAQITGSPEFLSIVGARLAQKGGETKSAIIVLNSMLAEKKPEEPGFADIKDRLQALEGVYSIELAREEFRKIRQRDPKSITELVASGFLKETPYNPYNLDYCLDASGNIYFDKPNCLEK